MVWKLNRAFPIISFCRLSINCAHFDFLPNITCMVNINKIVTKHPINLSQNIIISGGKDSGVFKWRNMPFSKEKEKRNTCSLKIQKYHYKVVHYRTTWLTRICTKFIWGGGVPRKYNGWVKKAIKIPLKSSSTVWALDRFQQMSTQNKIIREG